MFDTVEARPGSDQWERLHAGRITPSFVPAILRPGTKAYDDVLVQMVDALTNQDSDQHRGFAYMESAHAEKRQTLITTREVLPPFITDRFCIRDPEWWLGCAPQALVYERHRGDDGRMELGAFVTGISVRLYRRLRYYHDATRQQAEKLSDTYSKVQACMLVTDAPYWILVHSWADVRQELRRDKVVHVARDEAHIDEIYSACTQFMEDATRLALGRTA